MTDTRKYEQYAKKVKLFEGLNAEEVSEILHHGQTVEHRPGDSIFHKGQLGNNLYIVLNGTVNITLEYKIIAKCRVGDAFGEMSLLNHRPHCASADAATSVRLFILSEDQLNKILQKGVAVRLLLNIIHMLSAYLENANHINSTNTKLIQALKASNSEATIP
jgi:CRP-like cAMP-binding protein